MCVCDIQSLSVYVGDLVPQHTCRSQRIKSRVSPCLPHTVGSPVFTATWIRLGAPCASRLYLPTSHFSLWMRWNYRSLHYACGFYRVPGLKPRLVDSLMQWTLYPLKHLSRLIYIHFNSTRKSVLSSIDWCAGHVFIGTVGLESHINNVCCPHAKAQDVIHASDDHEILKACWSHMPLRWCWRVIPLASSAVIFPISTGSQWVKNSMTVHWMN